jgi:hypothetical protein
MRIEYWKWYVMGYKKISDISCADSIISSLVAEFQYTTMHDRGFWCNVDSWKFCCTHSLWRTVMVWLHLFSVIFKGGNLVLTQYNEYQQHCCESRHSVVHDRQVLGNVILVFVFPHHHGRKQEANGYPQLYIHTYTYMHLTDPFSALIAVEYEMCHSHKSDNHRHT